MEIYRICKKCNISKNIIDFGHGYNNGVIYYYKKCKFCDKDRVLNKNKRSKSKYRKKIANQQQIYYNLHKEECRAYNKKYYENNKEKIKNNSKNYLYNRRKNDVLFLLKDLFSSRIRNMIKKNGKSIKEILPYSIQSLKQHLESKFESWMNWENWGRYDIKTWNDQDFSTWKWNIDHIVPQSKFLFSSIDDEEFKKCWSLENLRPFSAKQNISEGARR